MSALFSPLELRGLELRNRCVVSPMLTYRAQNGHTNDWHLMNLGQYAAGGAGLVMMESTKVEARGCSTLKDAGLWADEFIPAVTRIVNLIHELGAHAGIQLGHSGRKAGMYLPWEGRGPLDLDEARSPDGQPWDLIGPSPIAHGRGYKAPRELSIKEIAEVIENWTSAARRAEQCGFDVLELHAAHGYLGHQFLSAHANQRSDAYGGTLHNRMRFVLETAEAVRAVWPADRPLFARLSAVDELGWTIEDSIALSRELAIRGVDVIDCSSGGIGGRNLMEPAAPKYGYQVPYAAAIRREAGVKSMAVGLIVAPSHAEAIIRDGEADLVAIGREFLQNPHWALAAADELAPAKSRELTPESYGYWLAKRKEFALPPYPSR